MKKNTTGRIIAALLGVGIALCGNAQTGVFGTGYFQNQYLFNPAMAGTTDKGVDITLAYMRDNKPQGDGPKTMYATADYGFSETMGAGITIMRDEAGLISTTRMMATYAYHIPLSADGQKKLRLGLSGGGVLQRLNYGDISGDLDDASLYNFNNRKTQFEADFGAAYTDSRLTVQASFPNMMAAFGNKERGVLGLATLFAAASYKFKLGQNDDGMSIEPKVAYRGFKGLKSIVDAGANAVLWKNILNVYGMYHTNQSITAGLGISLMNAFQLGASYSTKGADLKGYSVGNYFEVGVRYFFHPDK